MYTEQDAHIEVAQKIDEVMKTRDVHGAYELSELFAEQDDMESAEHFRKMSRQWQAEDDAYDEERDNQD